jgi:hypothetical protein
MGPPSVVPDTLPYRLRLIAAYTSNHSGRERGRALGSPDKALGSMTQYPRW